MDKREFNTYKKRLLKLADVLDKLPRKRFDFTKWVGNDWKGMQSLSCGTTACSLGWACTIPAFRKLGLYIKEAPGDGMARGIPALKDDIWSAPADVSKKIFGLNFPEHVYLFCSGSLYDYERDVWLPELQSDATPKQAAKHIRNFVKRWNTMGSVIPRFS